MDNKYDPKKIESKWQKIWQEKGYGKSFDFNEKPKHYHLVEFPYPSGDGLHVGHCMGYTASDAYSRMKRMQGHNVMFPIGWDAFGLPTENYAIKTGIHPSKATEQNVANFKKQMRSLGYSFDWDREVNTTDPDYYRWTQWIFLQFYKHAVVDGKLVEVSDDDTTTPRLAYQSEMPINWCPSCKIGLANEEVINGKCERCGTETEKRMQKQWMLRITAYADKLISGLEKVDYEEKIRTQQINWIGKSTGSNIKFRVILNDSEESRSNASLDPSASPQNDNIIEVFTTRADTLFGCTYVVIAPESNYMSKFKSSISNLSEVEEYIQKAKKKSDLERTELEKDKTGVELKGIKAINPINNEEVSVWVADYVLATYGTGAVMAVPAHDERDFEFAKKYNIPIKQVIMQVFGEPHGDEEPRHVATAVVRSKDGKFLAVRWKKFDWIGPVVGGIEENEDPMQAIEREVFEETGYKVKAIEPLGGISKAYFYAEHKGVWRTRYDLPILCELVEDEQYEVSDEEKNVQTPVWLSQEEILQKITHPDNRIGYERYFRGNYSNVEKGELINSGEFTGLNSEEGKKKITEKLKEIGLGDFTVNYKLRDWVFSRQHYWGEPIPIIHCEKCGSIPVAEDQLPVKLPEVEKYEPSNTGESPLAAITDWVEVKCPKCDGNAKRETDTMPNWAGSSWYFLRYCDSKNNEEFASRDKLKYWMPVDLYNGGMEHTNLHLLYSRFWHKFLYDLNYVPTEEPYQKRIAHGIILGSDGRKMSKSFGNVINPDEIVKQFSADTMRAYIMFIGPYDQESAWSTAGIQGIHRFLQRVYNNFEKLSQEEDGKELLIKLNQSIKGVTKDLENFHLNTVVSKLMEINNQIEKTAHVSEESYKKFLKLIFPVAPHMASELWDKLAVQAAIDESWPEADKKYLVADEIEIVVQVNGKVRDKITVSAEISDEELKKSAFESDKIKSLTDGKEIIKIIVVPKKLVSIVIR